MKVIQFFMHRIKSQFFKITDIFKFYKTMVWIIEKTFVLFVCINYFTFVLLLALLLKSSPTGEYSNLAFSTTLGLYPKPSPVKYSYLSNSLDDNAEI